MRKSLVTVITVVYNAKLTLEATIQSVINQDKELVDYWIIDGGSNDGSIEIIRQYESQLAGWCSEPDKGIYDAMNKGINRANSQWIYFLGGDDVLKPNIIRELQIYLNSRYAIVFGDVLFDNGHRMKSFLGQRTILQNTVHHQSAFYNASLFDGYRYDPTLTIVSEYEIHLRIYLKKVPTLYVPIVIAICALGGASSNLSRSLVETNRVRKRFIRSKWKNEFMSAFLSMYYAQKRLRYLLYGHRV